MAAEERCRASRVAAVRAGGWPVGVAVVSGSRCRDIAVGGARRRWRSGGALIGGIRSAWQERAAPGLGSAGWTHTGLRRSRECLHGRAKQALQDCARAVDPGRRADQRRRRSDTDQCRHRIDVHVRAHGTIDRATGALVVQIRSGKHVVTFRAPPAAHSSSLADWWNDADIGQFVRDGLTSLGSGLAQSHWRRRGHLGPRQVPRCRRPRQVRGRPVSAQPHHRSAQRDRRAGHGRKDSGRGGYPGDRAEPVQRAGRKRGPYRRGHLRALGSHEVRGEHVQR